MDKTNPGKTEENVKETMEIEAIMFIRYFDKFCVKSILVSLCEKREGSLRIIIVVKIVQPQHLVVFYWLIYYFM